jgi:hypothetical protein
MMNWELTFSGNVNICKILIQKEKVFIPEDSMKRLLHDFP